MTKIFMKPWLTFHGRTKILSTDGWYLDFANKLFPILDASKFLPREVEGKKHLAIVLTTYFEDCVGNDGRGWPHFTEMYHKRYGKYLPFYETSEGYMPDEINREDICFLLWSSTSGIDMFGLTRVEDPFNKELLKLATDIFNFMNEYFEQAPITDLVSGDWVIEPEYMEIDQAPVPEIKPGDVLKPDVERFLEASRGNPLMFFLNYSELKPFLVEVLEWPEKRGSLMEDLCESNNIVLYANAKGLIVAPEVGWYFADRRNKGYDKLMAAEEGYSIFCDKGCCPFDLLKYAMAHNLIPEVAFPFENGKKLLHDNWDFIARWFLREWFEGKLDDDFR